MILAAGIAAHAASALAHALQSKSKPGAPSTDFCNLTADIGALLPGSGRPGSNGAGSGTGSITGDISALGQDLLGALGFGGAGAPTSGAGAARAYAAADTLAT